MKIQGLKNIIASLLIFFGFYRVAFVEPLFLLSIPMGLVGLIFIMYSIRKNKIITKSVRINNFVYITFVFAGYIFLIDLANFGYQSSIKNLFLVRLIGLLLLSGCCAFFINYLLIKGDYKKLSDSFIVAIIIQFCFFLVMYFFPVLKESIYNIFGMANSPNLLEFNLRERGFGVGMEINFTSPITTAIAAILLMRNKIIKILLIFAQIANSTIAIFSLLFFAKKSINLIVVFFAFVVTYNMAFDVSEIIESILPRFGRELSSGFSITIGALMDRHLIYEGRTIMDLFFGSGINLLPEVGKDYSSDIGWVIMLNYAGLMSILLFMLFVISLISLTPFSLWIKIMLVACVCVLNTKGLLFGANSFFFFLFAFAAITIHK